jgi:DNA-binding transcriptional ArsR family regulator
MCRPITNRYYRGVVDIEIAAASSDLAKLRTAGVLAARGAGGGREYVGAPRLYRLVAERLGLAAELEADASEDQSRDHVLAALAQQARDEDEFVAREPSVRYGAQ